MVRALGVEDVIQCPFVSAGRTTGSSDGWSSGVYLLTRPLLPVPIRLLVRVVPWCGWSRFYTSDEVLDPLIRGDVQVCLSKQLFKCGGHFLQYGSDESQNIGSPVEIFNHRCLDDFGVAVSHGLKSLEYDRSVSSPWRLMDLRSHGCTGLSERDWMLAMNRRLKSLQSSMQCHGRCRSHCSASCPKTMGKYAVITSCVALVAQAAVV
jgi:hypothetical protein